MYGGEDPNYDGRNDYFSRLEGQKGVANSRYALFLLLHEAAEAAIQSSPPSSSLPTLPLHLFTYLRALKRIASQSTGHPHDTSTTSPNQYTTCPSWAHPRTAIASPPGASLPPPASRHPSPPARPRPRPTPTASHPHGAPQGPNLQPWFQGTPRKRPGQGATETL